MNGINNLTIINKLREVLFLSIVILMFTGCGASDDNSTPPSITLLGDNPFIQNEDVAFIEPGFEAFDKNGNKLEVVVSGNLDYTMPGIYYLSYSATDEYGNESIVEREIQIIDITPPEIDLVSGEEVNVFQWKQFIDPVFVTDNSSEIVNLNVYGDVNTKVLGQYSLEYFAEDLVGNKTTKVRIVNVLEAKPFKTRWNTNSWEDTDPNSIILYFLESTKNLYVDWGDGSKEYIEEGDFITHRYESPGVYEVSIWGDLKSFTFPYWGGDNEKLLSIEQWGDTYWNTMYRAFYRCRNLNINASDVPDLFLVEDMSEMFMDAGEFASDLNGWDVSSVKIMSRMFKDTNYLGDISDWDVSSVEDMSEMFSEGSIVSDLRNWDVSSVKNMNQMFYHSYNLNIDLSQWDVSSVQDMSNMFNGSLKFESDLSSWDVSSVNNMSGMFYRVENFNSDLNLWDVSSVNDMSYMFYEAKSFNSNLNNWYVSNVRNMSNMFLEAHSFKGLIGSWDVSSVLNMSSMFKNAHNFNGDLSKWDVSSVQDMSNMFNGATKFESELYDWDVSSVVNMSGMFKFNDVFQGDLKNWDVSSVTDMSYMFYRAFEFESDLSQWNVSRVINMEHMFYQAKKFNSELEAWDVSSVERMEFMFSGAVIFNRDISGWDTSLVENMDGMFAYSGFINGNIGSWDISSVRLMFYMFDGISLESDVYDDILQGWASQNVKQRVVFDAGDSQHSSSSLASKNLLINTYEWTIKDGGLQ